MGGGESETFFKIKLFDYIHIDEKLERLYI